MKKVRLFFSASMLVSSALFSQTLNDAIKQTTNEQFEPAEATFKSLVQSNPTSGEIYFYYGENFFRNDKKDQAAPLYNKAVEVNAASPFGYIGQGKILWEQGKQTDAKASFYKAQTLSANKNATVLMKIAEEYINAEQKSLVDAFPLLDLAAKLEPKNPEVFVLMGDAFLEQNNGNKAIENYEKAAALDPKSVRATLKQGQLWNRSRNYEKALEFYKKAKLIDSSFAPAYRELAEIYFRAGQYKTASAQYKRYLELNPNCSAKARYAGFLEEAKQYAESVEAAKEALKCDSNNVFLYRYLAFDYYFLKNYEDGMKASKKYFAKKTPDVKEIPQDYEYRGKFYAQTGSDSLAIIDFKKAMEMDTTRKELNNDIAGIYMKLKKFKEAIEIYQRKIKAGKGNVNDSLAIGRAYYYSKDYVNADTTFADVIRLRPSFYQGYLWRAKTNVQMDPDPKTSGKWAAKAYYEGFIAKLKPEDTEKQKTFIIEAYNYLGFYNLNKKEYCTAKSFFLLVFNLDQTNATAKKILDSPESKKCQ